VSSSLLQSFAWHCWLCTRPRPDYHVCNSIIVRNGQQPKAAYPLVNLTHFTKPLATSLVLSPFCSCWRGTVGSTRPAIQTRLAWLQSSTPGSRAWITARPGMSRCASRWTTSHRTSGVTSTTCTRRCGRPRKREEPRVLLSQSVSELRMEKLTLRRNVRTEREGCSFGEVIGVEPMLDAFRRLGSKNITYQYHEVDPLSSYTGKVTRHPE
jgi:hypothetical protein